MTAAGFPLEGVDRSGTDTYPNSGDAVDSGAQGRCYAQEFAEVEMMWQGAQEKNSAN